MGNKCRFCVTSYGNVKRVAGVLQGNGCGCGRCSGQFTDRAELDRAIDFYKSELATLDKHEEYIQSYRDSLKADLALLGDIQTVK